MKKQIDWNAVDWNLSNKKLARKYRVTTQKVSLARGFVGHKRPPKMDQFDWSGVDWTLTEFAIVAKHGIPLHHVRKKRISLGLPLGKQGRKPVGPKDPRVKVKFKKLDFTKTNQQLSVIHKVSHERIRQLRLAAGLPSSSTLHEEPEWKSKIDPKKTISENARTLNVDASTVNAFVKRMGIECNKYQKPCKHNWHSADWNQPSPVIAKQLGITKSYVSKRRSKYAPKTVGKFRVNH